MSFKSKEKQLYYALDKLVADPKSVFISTVQEKDGLFYRIFNYNVASYEDFLMPFAREGRGTTFEVTKNNEFIRLVSLPPHKFFNDSENPFTQNLDYSNIDLIMDKLDGSLMSTYVHINEAMQMDVYLKSKGSLHSDYAKVANKLLATEEYFELKSFLYDMAISGHTVNLEFTSNDPQFRVVLRYPETKLTVFSVRKHEDFSYIPYQQIKKDMLSMGVNLKHLVPNYAEFHKGNEVTFIQSIKDMDDDIEGFVVVIKNGETVKLKTSKYLTLHKARADIIDSPKNLFEIVVDEKHDDLRAAFSYDPYLLKLIEDMEKKVKSIYLNIHKEAQQFYEKNKSLDRKSYAILAKKTVKPLYFGLAMNLHIGRETDFKDFIKKHYKEFKIKDSVTESINSQKMVKNFSKPSI
jgi:T4 RnlA family RNA ligase